MVLNSFLIFNSKWWCHQWSHQLSTDCCCTSNVGKHYY